MAMPRPSLLFDFSNMPDFLDSRITFTRASVASYFDRDLVLRYRPANVPRFTYGLGGVCNGLMVERSFNNLTLWSEDFTQAAWTKTNVTATAAAGPAPDGSNNANTLAVTAASGAVTQAITITAAQNPVWEVFVQANASNWAQLSITDGTNTVTCWYDLVNYVVGTHTAGAGTLLYHSASINPAVTGTWCRIRLTCTSSTITSVTLSISAAAADNTAPASGNSLNAWGAQGLGAANVIVSVTYVPSTGTLGTHVNEIAVLNTLDPAWYNPNAGTVVCTVCNMCTTGSASAWGLGNTTTDHLYALVGYNTVNVQYVVTSGNVVQASMTQAIAGYTAGAAGWDTPAHIAQGWAVNNFASCGGGGTLGTDVAGALPVNPIRMRLGDVGWSAAVTANALSGCIRRWAYYPQRLTNAQLQALTVG